MSLGMQLSVLCSEDSPRYTAGRPAARVGRHRVRRRPVMGQARACEFWPKGTVDPSYYEPVRPTCRRWCCRAISTR